ncbi:MAG: acylphosphatase [Thiotrichales bacterium]|nr:acylphosphatase [Thiotrichales bacterium]
MKAKRFLVAGRVQGVCYRISTLEQARQLGLTGWVRNLEDGNVEVFACGNGDGLQALEDWLHDGPAMARVSTVQAVEVEPELFDGFSIR